MPKTIGLRAELERQNGLSDHAKNFRTLMKVSERIAEKKVFFFVDPIYLHQTPIFEKVAQNSPKCRHFENLGIELVCVFL